MKTMGEQAKEFRESKGWNSARMASEVSKHHQKTVSRQLIEQLEEIGDRTPQYLKALAKTMGTTTDLLLNGMYRVPADEPQQHTVQEPMAHYTVADSTDLMIHQYPDGGSMGHGVTLEEKPPGIIKSWNVSRDWIRLNVPLYTSTQNLCIVTGFGPSMRPLFNPGDPLLMDRGVKKVDQEGVFFFRLGDLGYIKQLQRIPTENGLVLRAKSLAATYDNFDITPKMYGDFECFGKILTVWKSEQV